MSNKENNKAKTFFLKVSPFLKNFIERKYGSPVEFPIVSVYHSFMQRFLVDNPGFKKLSDFSYSYTAFNIGDYKNLFTMNIDLPSEQERKNFVEIVIPSKLYRTSGVVIPTTTYDISSSGAKAIRAEISREFWIDFSKFNDECVFRASRMSERVRLKDVMLDFIILNRINIGDLDKLVRYWWRWRAKIKDDIEKKREHIETELDILLKNTP